MTGKIKLVKMIYLILESIVIPSWHGLRNPKYDSVVGRFVVLEFYDLQVTKIFREAWPSFGSMLCESETRKHPISNRGISTTTPFPSSLTPDFYAPLGLGQLYFFKLYEQIIGFQISKRNGIVLFQTFQHLTLISIRPRTSTQILEHYFSSRIEAFMKFCELLSFNFFRMIPFPIFPLCFPVRNIYFPLRIFLDRFFVQNIFRLRRLFFLIKKSPNQTAALFFVAQLSFFLRRLKNLIARFSDGLLFWS